MIIADDDGVVVVPRGRAREVLESASRRVAAEETKRTQLASGALGLDLNDMRNDLADRGLVYEDAGHAGRDV